MGRTVQTIVLVGTLVILVGAVAALSVYHSRRVEGVATVQLRIDGPDGAHLYDASVHGRASVYGVLHAASVRDGFPLEVEHYSIGTMVVQIFDHRNQGACGWVYEVDGRSGDRSADDFAVHDGEVVHWFWTCDETFNIA